MGVVVSEPHPERTWLCLELPLLKFLEVTTWKTWEILFQTLVGIVLKRISVGKYRASFIRHEVTCLSLVSA